MCTLLAAATFLLAPAACVELSFHPDQVPTSLAVVPADTMLTIGDAAQYSVIVLDAEGEPIEPHPSWVRPVWSSADTSAVEVSANGVVRAVDYAETRITVSLAGLRAQAPVRVSPSSIVLDASVWYVLQTVQNRNRDVPLIQGRDALLRVFVTGDRPSYYQPRVEVLFYENNVLAESVMLAPEFRQLPTVVDEGALDQSYDLLIPGRRVTPATEMAIRIDPQGVVPHDGDAPLRIPADGRLQFDLRQVPPLDVVLVPVWTGTDHDSDVQEWLDEIGPDTEELRETRTLLPVDEVSVTVLDGFHSTFDLSRGKGWTDLLAEIVFLRIANGSQGHYYGVVQPPPDLTINGLAQIGEPHAVGRPDGGTLAHELGHTFGLAHAPCGGAGSVDQAYPYQDGAIGVWGFDFEQGRVVNASVYKDVMSYCNPRWISDYHYDKAMEHRLTRGAEQSPRTGEATTRAERQSTLLVWGWAGGGDLALDPSFVVDAPALLPVRGGPYRVDGVGRGGGRVFSLDFEVRPSDHAHGVFVFTVPYDPDVDGALDRLVLTGPEGTHALEQRSAPPMAMVTDPATGRLRAILRDWDGALPGELRGTNGRTGRGRVEVTVSEGLPPTVDRRR